YAVEYLKPKGRSNGLIFQVGQSGSDGGRWQKPPPAFSFALRVELPVIRWRRRRLRARRRRLREPAFRARNPTRARLSVNAKGEARGRGRLCALRATAESRESHYESGWRVASSRCAHLLS